MFIDLRLKAASCCRFQSNTTVKAFEFIDLGIYRQLGAVATVVQNHIGMGESKCDSHGGSVS